MVEYAGRWYANNKLMPEPPESVRQSVDEWRGRSDDLRAHFEERMEADPGSYVLGSEYLADFNDRLAREGGNRQEWSPKLFAQRLQGHEGLPARMEKVKKRLGDGWSRRPVLVTSATPSAPQWVWLGVKFKEE